MMKSISKTLKAKKELQIHRIAILNINKVSFLKDTLGQERCCCRYTEDTMVEHYKAAEADLTSNLCNLAALVDPGGIPVQHVNPATAPEGFSYGGKTPPPRQMIVVRL